jgi:hypothetical protein
MSGDSWDELLEKLNEDDAVVGESEWGRNLPLEVGTVFAGWWRGEDIWRNRDGGRTTPVYLLRDGDGTDVFIWGGRSQLDKKIANAALSPGDRVAIRREPDGPAEAGFKAPWRVRVAVLPGEGSLPPARSVHGDEPAVVGESDEFDDSNDLF